LFLTFALDFNFTLAATISSGLQLKKTHITKSKIGYHLRKKKMPRELRFRPGSSALRLSNIEQLSSEKKTELIRSVADDITAVFVYIARQSEAGNLTTTNTEPINDVISIIKDTEVKHRQKLEEKVAQYRRATQRLRKERQCLRVQLGRITKRTQVAVGGWEAKMDELTAGLAEAQKRVALVQEKYELLQLSSNALGQAQKEQQLQELQQSQPAEMGKDAEQVNDGNDSNSVHETSE
jgi:hypothetical protein